LQPSAGALCTGADCDAVADKYSSTIATPPFARTTSKFVGPMAARSSGNALGVPVCVAVAVEVGVLLRVTVDVAVDVGVFVADTLAVTVVDAEAVDDGVEPTLSVADGEAVVELDDDVVGVAVVVGVLDCVGVGVVDGVLVDVRVGVGVGDMGARSACKKP